MPELPEVEVVRRDLEPALVGRTIRAVEVGRDRAVRREPDPRAFARALRGRTVAATSRVGKFLVVHLDGHGDVVVAHLGMSGQLRLAAGAAVPRPPHTHVVWSLDDGSELRFVDPRTFGQMWMDRVDAPASRARGLAHLGPDALDASAGTLAPRLADRRVAVKMRLMDQTALAGLGNIYTDEILFRARIAPIRGSGTLTDPEIESVARETRAVLVAAIAARGSSLADGQYVDGYGRAGTYQRQHAVHARAGAPCLRCGATVTRTRMGGRFASWCPGCQS